MQNQEIPMDFPVGQVVIDGVKAGAGYVIVAAIGYFIAVLRFHKHFETFENTKITPIFSRLAVLEKENDKFITRDELDKHVALIRSDVKERIESVATNIQRLDIKLDTLLTREAR
jgi:hypothetical protein